MGLLGAHQLVAVWVGVLPTISLVKVVAFDVRWLSRQQSHTILVSGGLTRAQ